MKAAHVIAFILTIVGGLNWGLVGLGGFFAGNWNLVHMILGSWPSVEWLVYILVGVSAIVLVATHGASCKHCEAKPAGQAM
jgi:uncharacterized membrane protein YuzA (DUF378 family)